MKSKRKLLIAEDNEINRKILCNILSDEYEVVTAENGKEAFDILKKENQSISVVLLDLFMPIMNGFEFLEKIKEDTALAKTPIIVVTQHDDEITEIKALSLGAYDFLMKPYNPLIVKHRVANTIKLLEKDTFINQIEKDRLTGVLSRDFFFKKSFEIMQENIENRYDIISVDIERFKIVNDIAGIKTGDELLKYAAETLVKHFGRESICGRINADNFVILTPHKKTYDSGFFGEIIRELNEFPININLVMHFGIYEVDDVYIPISTMCDRAKLAINKIKGKYSVYHAYYDEAIRQRLLDEQFLIDNMKNGLKNEQFQVYYQPKYHVNTNKIVGAEALVRWHNPIKGLMPPSEFIPLFEKNGFITDLDMFVWNKTCQNIGSWIKAGKKPTVISVNVSRADIYIPNLPEILMDIVRKNGLLPKYIHLEITETAYTEDSAQLIEVVSKLKHMGFVIEMDDFGTGYSSLNMLSELPIDILKLDMRFIQSQSAMRKDKNILNFIISLAKWLDLLVIAEGVETAEQLQMLRNIDCPYVQGRYYAKPLPQNEFEELLSKSEIMDI